MQALQTYLMDPQIGFIIFMHDDSGRIAPLTWASKKAQRVARSTLAAETLAAAEAADHAILIKTILEELLGVEIPPVTIIVDNKSLWESVRSTGLLTEKRLLIEMSSIRELHETGKINVEWVDTHNQIADCLTKAGANKQKLVDILSQGNLNFDKIRSG